MVTETYPSHVGVGNVYLVSAEGNEYPILSTDPRTIYAKNSAGQDYYPRDKYRNEFYARIENAEVPIEHSNKQIYARHAVNGEVYPRDASGREYVLLSENDKPYYAKSLVGKEKYPRTVEGNEYVAKNGPVAPATLPLNAQPFWIRFLIEHRLYIAIAIVSYLVILLLFFR